MCRSLLVAMLMSIATLAPVAAAADAQLAALQNHDALAKEVTQTLRIDELLAVMSAEALGDIGGDVNPESGGIRGAMRLSGSMNRPGCARFLMPSFRAG